MAPAVPPFGLRPLLVAPNWSGLKFDEMNGTIEGVIRFAMPAPPPTPSSIKIPAIAGWRPIVSTSENVARDVKNRFIRS
jgi:hypothetical protein